MLRQEALVFTNYTTFGNQIKTEINTCKLNTTRPLTMLIPRVYRNFTSMEIKLIKLVILYHQLHTRVMDIANKIASCGRYTSLTER